MRQRKCASDPLSWTVVKPIVPYWIHLEVAPVIFNVNLGHTTSCLLIHLHGLDAVLYQEETPNQGL
jgi:hypothetical protein